MWRCFPWYVVNFQSLYFSHEKFPGLFERFDLFVEGEQGFFFFRWKICRSSLTIWFVSWLSRRSFCVSGSMNGTEWKKVGWGKKFIEREKRYDWHICCEKKMKFISVKKKIYTSCCLQVTRIRNTLQTRSTLESRFVSNSHCNLIFLRYLWRSCH